MGSIVSGITGAIGGFMSGGPVGAVVGGVGGYLAAEASEKPAEAQQQAAQQAAETTGAASERAIALQKRMYEETVARGKPWTEAGEKALGIMGVGTFPGTGEFVRPFTMADYQADPGYAFRLKEGMRGIEQSAAARGGYLSGNALKAITGYGQEMGSQEYQNAYNRYVSEQTSRYNKLANIAGYGQTSNAALQQAGGQYATQSGGYGMQAAGDIGSAQLAAGQSRASAYQGQANTLGKAFGTLSSAWGNYNQPQSGGYWT